MKLLYLALLGPILWLGTAPTYVAAVPVALAAILSFLEYCHQTAKKAVKTALAAKHAPEHEDGAASDVPEGAMSSADELVRNKLIAAGMLVPGVRALSEATETGTDIPVVTLSGPLPLSAVVASLPEVADAEVLAQSAADAFIAVPPEDVTIAAIEPAIGLATSVSELNTLELSIDNDWASDAQGY